MSIQFVIFNPWKVPWNWITFYQDSFVVSPGCYISWLDATLEDLQTRPLRQILLCLRNNSLKLLRITNWIGKRSTLVEIWMGGGGVGGRGAAVPSLRSPAPVSMDLTKLSFFIKSIESKKKKLGITSFHYVSSEIWLGKSKKLVCIDQSRFYILIIVPCFYKATSFISSPYFFSLFRHFLLLSRT